MRVAVFAACVIMRPISRGIDEGRFPADLLYEEFHFAAETKVGPSVDLPNDYGTNCYACWVTRTRLNCILAAEVS